MAQRPGLWGGRTAALLLALCAVGLAQALLLQHGAAETNPLARVPVMDAAVYWDWAGRIARGRLVGAEPFFSAPLYPFLLGLVRALGGGVSAALVVQAVLHAATVGLIGRAGWLRFGAGTGLGAALAYALLADPLFHAGRLLPCTLQAFCAAWALERFAAHAARPSTASAAALGLVYGLACLAWPPLLVGLPLLALWLARARDATGARGGRRRTALATLLALYAIAPATIHNWRASGEPILISGQAGLTFLHGNRPGARGVYVAAPGISPLRAEQNADARARASEALGHEASWRETSAWAFDRGLAWWRAEPAAALAATGRKAWYFLSGRHYGDVYAQELERAEGLLPYLALAPVPVAWLAPVALVAAFLLLARRRLAALPEALLLLLPLLVVALFFYSPRYRMPATPAIALLAAWALVRLARERPRRAALAASGAALVLGVSSGALNAGLGFDRSDARLAHFHQVLGEVCVQEDDLGVARVHFERALELGHPSAEAGLADVERRGGDFARAVRTTLAEARAHPDDALAWRAHAVTLALAGRPADALPVFERVVALDPTDAEALSGLGNVLVALDHLEAGLARYDQALAADPDHLMAAMNKAIALLGADRLQEAADAVVPVVQRLADAPEPRWLLADIVSSLATDPDPARRDGMRALELGEVLAPGRESDDPRVLEALYLALGETATFPEAERLARRAAALLRGRGEADWAADAERYADAFARGEMIYAGE